MSIVFPLVASSGSTLRVDRRFPPDDELISLPADSWSSFLTYYSASSQVIIRAPFDGTIQFVQKPLLTLRPYLLLFRPIHFSVFQGIPGWSTPVPKAFVFQYSDLDAEENRLAIYVEAKRQFQRRSGSRRIRALSSGGRIESWEWDNPGSDLETQARNDLALGTPMTVFRGQPVALAPAGASVAAGMVYYEGSDFAAATPYWMDFHEYFVRRKAYAPSADLGFPFDERPSGAFFRIRYERSDNLRAEGGNAFESIAGGLQDVRIFHPPTEQIESGGRFSARTRPIPKEIFTFTPGSRLVVRFSNAPATFRYVLFNNTEATAPLHRTPDFTGRELETPFGNLGYAWPDRRRDPLNIACVAAGGAGLSFTVVRDLIRAVDEAASELIGYKARLAEFLQNRENAELALLIDTINGIRHMAPRDLADRLRGAIDNTRVAGAASRYEQLVADKASAVEKLTQRLDADFFAQLTDNFTDEALVVFDKAIEALRNEDGGDQFLADTFRNFFFSRRYVDDPLPPIEFEVFKAAWNTLRAIRPPLVKVLYEGVKEDMFYHLRLLAQRSGSTIDQVATAELRRLQDEFTHRFGELFALRVRSETPTVDVRTNPITGEVASVSHTYFTPTRTIIEYDTDAIAQIDVNRTTGMSGATYARETLARAVNLLNLLGSIWQLWVDALQARSQDDFTACYNVLKDLVDIVDAFVNLMPTNHYSGVRARPGWSAVGGGLSFVFNAVSLSSMIDGSWDRHASGDYRSAGLMGLAASSAALSLGGEALALLGAGAATSGPLAFVIVGGTLLSIVFSLLAEASARPGIEIDFRHTYFGVDYPDLEAQYDRLPEDVRRNPVELFFRNQRFSWVRNVPHQIAHLNRYTEPVTAQLTVRTERDTAGREETVIAISLLNVRCEVYSRVYFELYAPGTPDFGTAGTFVITPEAARTRRWQRPSAPHDFFEYQVAQGPNGTAEIYIRTRAPHGSPFANVNRAVVGVTFFRAVEYSLPSGSGAAVDELRANPYRVDLHGPLFDRTAAKFMVFLEAS